MLDPRPEEQIVSGGYSSKFYPVERGTKNVLQDPGNLFLSFIVVDHYAVV